MNLLVVGQSCVVGGDSLTVFRTLSVFLAPVHSF